MGLARDTLISLAEVVLTPDLARRGFLLDTAAELDELGYLMQPSLKE